MAAGLGHLRLAPADFWSMTPKEFAAAVSILTDPAAIAAPLARADLASLMQRYPD